MKKVKSEIVELSDLLTDLFMQQKNLDASVLNAKKVQNRQKYITIFCLNLIGKKIIFSSLYGCKLLNYASFRRFSQFLKIKSQLS
jgi:hypothetical protein